MKYIKLAFTRLSKKRMYSIIILFQVIFMLVILVPFINEILEGPRLIAVGEKFEKYKAIYFMNKNEYIDFDNGFEILNKNEIIRNNEKLNKILNSSKIFKSISPLMVSGYREFGNIGIPLGVFDSVTLENISNDELVKEISEYSGKNIPVIVSRNSNYKIGEVVIDNEGKSFEILGFFNNSREILQVKMYSNRPPRFSELYRENLYSGKVEFITLNKEELRPLLNDDIFSDRIIYFNENSSELEIENLLKKIRDENIGLITTIEEMIEQDKIFISNRINKNIDMFFILIIIVATTIFTISNINYNKFRKYLDIFIKNGAKKLELFITFCVYYLLILGLPIILYFIFSIILEESKLIQDYFGDVIFKNYYMNIETTLIVGLLILVVSVINAFILVIKRR